MIEKVAKKANVSKADSSLQTQLGTVVRACRQQLGITQEELAWRADMHRTYIADIERGARNVTLRSLANLAKALGVSVGNLLSYATARAGAARLQGGAEAESNEAGEILLIEDNAIDAALAVRAFKRAKITNPIVTIGNGEDGLDYLFSKGKYAKGKPVRPQLILLDLNLPEISGVDFLRRVKADKRTRDIPVVVLTVSQSDHMIAECDRLGAANYIVKPLGIESFVRVIPKLNLYLTLGSQSEPKAKTNS